MRTYLHTALLAATLCAAGTAQAQKIAPGLWEQSITMKSAGGQMDAAMAQMQEQLARMTPEQRKQMEAMMGSRGGAGMALATGKPASVKVCITPEQAARDEVPQTAQQGNCQQTSRERSGNTLKFKFTCTGDRPATGNGEYTFSSDKAHTGRVVVDTTVRGQPERIEIDNSGRWLSADCGDVKPRPSAPAAK
jgi:hypothetical protein